MGLLPACGSRSGSDIASTGTPARFRRAHSGPMIIRCKGTTPGRAWQWSCGAAPPAGLPAPQHLRRLGGGRKPEEDRSSYQALQISRLDGGRVAATGETLRAHGGAGPVRQGFPGRGSPPHSSFNTSRGSLRAAWRAGGPQASRVTATSTTPLARKVTGSVVGT